MFLWQALEETDRFGGKGEGAVMRGVRHGETKRRQSGESPRTSTLQGQKVVDVLALILCTALIGCIELGTIVVELADLVHEVDRVALLVALLVHVAVELDGVPRVPHVRAALNLGALEPAEVG